MTNPRNPTPVAGADNASGSESVTSATSAPASSEKKTLVRCHATVNYFKSADGSFPDVTPAGVEMNDNELAAAKAAAKACRMKLITNRGHS